ncbi:MAG: T9SS type A sorting domain-containing protein, partial [Segetibacter sp.]|nr:T9SS type A sorting domain-containing protein [Segetibacter sp.]
SVNNNCRLSPKPIKWDYYQNPNRKHVYDVFSNLIKLRFHPFYKNAFISGSIDRSLASGFKWLKLSSGDTSHLFVVGNFDVNASSGNVTFPSAGTWYDYLTNTTITTTGTTQSFNLQPGEYHVYLNRDVNNNAPTPVITIPASGNVLEAKIFPNPVQSGFTVELYLPQSGKTSFELLNVAGQQAGVLKQGFMIKGKQQVTFNKTHLPRGQYYLKIITTKETKILKLIF